MNAEMMEAENRLVRLMREIMNRWPQVGIVLIMKAQRQVIHDDVEVRADLVNGQSGEV